MKILILGVTGMLGHSLFGYFTKYCQHDVWGTIRNKNESVNLFEDNSHVISNVDVLDQDSLVNVFTTVKPDLVINCVGLIKQLKEINNPLITLPINSLLPHRLANLCNLSNARLIHFSTDCVFSGEKGMYTETDKSDAQDLYGQSKYMGEISNMPNVVTLRTSIIGHELNSSRSLVDWFLSQSGSITGYAKAVFSGLPTVEVARIINEFIIPNLNLSGLYHMSVSPIDKYSLLKLIAKIYNKDIDIKSSEQVNIDRSLNSTKFRDATGYVPPAWNELIQLMYNHHQY